MSIRLAEANQAINAALAKAHNLAVNICVTVCNADGRLVVFQRMDGALAEADLASIGKALASVRTGRPSGDESIKLSEYFRAATVTGEAAPRLRRPGGLPIIRAGQIEGALGVAGASDDQAVECALDGIDALEEKGGPTMKIIVIGGTGLIGSKTVAILRQGGHEAVAASPKSGINTITGEGLKEAMAGAHVVIDLANSPSFEDKAVLEFFETSGRNLLAAGAAAGVRHHVALSVVGTDRTDNGYFRAKVAQEKLIEASGIPYTIIRSTQFLEFLGAIAASSADGNIVRISPGLFQPIAADDVAAIVADVALAAPRNGIVEIAGPERAPFNEIVARYLKAIDDPRKVVSDPEARYFGGKVEECSLVPLGEARLGRIGFDEWLRRSQAAA
jgi:uncharacterized protein YbjT (DUF2867 family)/uncharacterized protein GlcG (DUF336 family)